MINWKIKGHNRWKLNDDELSMFTLFNFIVTRTRCSTSNKHEWSIEIEFFNFALCIWQDRT